VVGASVRHQSAGSSDAITSVGAPRVDGRLPGEHAVLRAGFQPMRVYRRLASEQLIPVRHAGEP
jgi:hypothetical protein